jgi:hypothetical protein
MTDKTFTHAGVSTLNGETKVRYANDALRVKVLAKGGHTNIDILDLGEPMTKEAAVLKLIDIKFGQGEVAIEQALAAELSKREPKAAKEKAPTKTAQAVTARAVKTAKSKAKPITLDTIKARAPKAKVDADLEDAPF